MDSGGAQLIVRGWLSANNIVFAEAGRRGATAVVDTGYAAHEQLTLGLVRHALQGRALEIILNTHIHSDHCGGNRILQSAFPSAQTLVPEDFQDAVQTWNEADLSFAETGQRCEPFRSDHSVRAGDRLLLGDRFWEAHSAPGHDPGALMFFEPVSRTLLSGDALWEKRLAIIFPELAGEGGFELAHQTLDAIERLSPNLVLPGHGAGFTDVAAALHQSRNRLDAFAGKPDRHRSYAARALAMFHMLEHRSKLRSELEQWMTRTPIFNQIFAGSGLARVPSDGARQHAHAVIESLLEDGALEVSGQYVQLTDNDAS
jgi:glyoxylase-like metal-dependent hydrolase (beta-lactamase superfamily II)